MLAPSQSKSRAACSCAFRIVRVRSCLTIKHRRPEDGRSPAEQAKARKEEEKSAGKASTSGSEAEEKAAQRLKAKKSS